jgi:hypothetical protein
MVIRERPGNIPVPLNELEGLDLGELELKEKKFIKEMNKQTAELHTADKKDEPETDKAKEEEDEGTVEGEDEGEGGEVVVSPPPGSIFDDDDTIYLGLHVYTKKGAESKVDGQLRHEMEVVFHGLAALTGLPGTKHQMSG